jgi:hypothetical protein
MKMRISSIGVIVCVLAVVSLCKAEMPALLNPYANQPTYPLSVYCSIPGVSTNSDFITYLQLPFDGQLEVTANNQAGFCRATADTQQGYFEVAQPQTRGSSSVSAFTTTQPTSGVLDVENPSDGSVTFSIEVWAPSEDGMMSNQTKMLGLLIWRRTAGGMQWWVDKWVNGMPADPRIAQGTDAFDFNTLSGYISQISDGRTIGYYYVTIQCYSEIGGAAQSLHGRVDFAQWRTLTINTSPAGLITVQPGVGEFTYPEHALAPIAAAQSNNCPDVYVFDHWEGPAVLDPNAAETTVLMDNNVQITAVFNTTRACGDACHGYPEMDFNHDCIVNLADLTELLEDWLVCTKPECD